MTTAAPEETPAAAPKPKKPRLTPKEWAIITALWEAGEVTYAELVAKYERNSSTFQRYFEKNGIKKGSKRDAINKKVAEQVAAAELSDVQIIAQRIRETKEEHYRMAAALGRLTWNEILQAKKDKSPFSIALNNLKALNAAIVNLKVVREERYAVLGLDRDDAVDPDQIPELIISELTPEQVKALRDRDHTELETGGSTRQGPEAPDSDSEEDEDDGIVALGED